MQPKTIFLGILDSPFKSSDWLIFLIFFSLIVLFFAWFIRMIRANSDLKAKTQLHPVTSNINEDDVTITGGWSGQITEAKDNSTRKNSIKKRGRIVLRGVVQKGAEGMRIQVYDNDYLKQVEVKAGRWAKGIREGDIILLVGRWKNKSFVKAFRIYNETTGVNFKPSILLPIILIFVIIIVIIIIGSL